MVALGFFVTGTDTGVGKTLAACALLHAFAVRGLRVVGMKPVAAGREDGRYTDVDALRDASNVRADLQRVNPYAFEPPIAPHIAAEMSGLSIDIDHLVRAHRALALSADVVIVEGAGGFMIPLNHRETSADLAQQLGLPVLLVVGMRLGCLNHALLTRRAIQAQGLACAGWICNVIDPQMLCFDENRDSLIDRLDAPLIGTFPHTVNPVLTDYASYLNLDVLQGARRE
ncbi:MAG: dethiobiotin synthase [Burkholderiales bacterium]